MSSVNTEMLLICNGCKGRLPVKEMRYDKDGKSLLCGACRSKASPKVNNEFDRAKLRALPTAVAASSTVRKSSGSARYHCESCNYRFSRDEDFVFKQCPNCSERKIRLVQPVYVEKTETDRMLEDLYG